eukprot:scaffold21988_cov53-Attheya_sp.AAC.4
MSSLAATQADGYYVPPEYLDSGAYKKQSINQFVGSKGHNQYLQNSVVRFELPYNGMCKKCQVPVGKGTRFNAQKSHGGLFYLTTKIWEFRMTCRSCAKGKFLIRTNPKEQSFDYVEGIHKTVQEFDTLAAESLGVVDTDIGQSIVPSSSRKESSSNGRLGKLEEAATSSRQWLSEHDHMVKLLKSNDATFKDDAASNAFLRDVYRSDRKAKRKRLHRASQMGLGRGIEVDCSEAEDSINEKVKSDYRQERSAVIDRRAQSDEQDTFKKIRGSGIFGSTVKERRRSKKEYRRQRARTTRRANDEAIPVIKNTSSASPQKKIISTTQLIGNFRDGNSRFALTRTVAAPDKEGTEPCTEIQYKLPEGETRRVDPIEKAHLLLYQHY